MVKPQRIAMEREDLDITEWSRIWICEECGGKGSRQCIIAVSDITFEYGQDGECPWLGEPKAVWKIVEFAKTKW